MKRNLLSTIEELNSTRIDLEDKGLKLNDSITKLEDTTFELNETRTKLDNTIIKQAGCTEVKRRGTKCNKDRT